MRYLTSILNPNGRDRDEANGNLGPSCDGVRGRLVAGARLELATPAYETGEMPLLHPAI